MFGIITNYNSETGIGWITSAETEATLFVVKPRTKLSVGQRVSFNIGTRAVQIEADNSELGQRIG
jgi:cold shock CspA family protein